jgi:hypothetical protein
LNDRRKEEEVEGKRELKDLVLGMKGEGGCRL